MIINCCSISIGFIRIYDNNLPSGNVAFATSMVFIILSPHLVYKMVSNPSLSVKEFMSLYESSARFSIFHTRVLVLKLSS